MYLLGLGSEFAGMLILLQALMSHSVQLLVLGPILYRSIKVELNAAIITDKSIF